MTTAVATTHTLNPRDRDLALDGIRGLAILLIVIHHVVVYTPIDPVSRAERLGYSMANTFAVGVDLFFVLSGFLITRVLLNSLSSSHYFRAFYSRRALRIFPLYYTFLATLIFALPLIFQDQAELKDLKEHQAWYWLYASNYRTFFSAGWMNHLVNHTWSVAIEEQFYLLWPVVVWLLAPRKVAYVSFAVTVASPILRAYLVKTGHDENAIRVLGPTHLDGLMMGAAVAALGVTAQAWMERNWRKLAVLCLGAGLVGRGSTGLVFHIPFEVARSTLDATFWSLIFTSMVTTAVYADPGSPFRRWLSSRALVFFGTYSYGLYLIHQPVILGVSRWVSPHMTAPATAWLLVACVGGILSMGMAMLSYRYLETPFLKLRRHFVSTPHASIAITDIST